MNAIKEMRPEMEGVVSELPVRRKIPGNKLHSVTFDI